MHLIKFRRRVAASQASHEDQTSHVMWHFFFKRDIASFLCSISNGDDSHLSVSSKPLIEDEETNRMVTPKFSLFIPMFFDEKNILRCFE